MQVIVSLTLLSSRSGKTGATVLSPRALMPLSFIGICTQTNVLLLHSRKPVDNNQTLSAV